ncbi:extracellular solute-binding protein [Alkalihalobacillus trypoxylicola]|uniref:ABC transporter substrate-binding protein n=1 Tax=Alkalihalobacillus trypoxylicola TaxID=519424 RepID=A0A162EZH0_9BACI|nr:extracellular solute-binding protein [Alkalihalobacillus trypoxylicola]KYG34110.1 ABC transporter substrate-binding protein [Alkalihalobacillus trypoxylicola]
MNVKISKSASIVVFLLMMLVLFGCSNQPSVTEDGRPILNGIMVKHALTKGFDEMEWLQEAEERAGVEIKWEEVSADWDQKKGAMLAGGDIPDIIVGANVITNADFAQFPGLFDDMTELIEEHAPNVQKMFDDRPEMRIIATQLDGQILGLPKYQRYWPETSTRQFINKTWLDELGLEIPTTWDELFDVLKAFKEEDANGNGNTNDEIPFDFSPVGTGGFGFFQPSVLLGSTGMTISGGGGQGYFVEDGEVKNFFIDERYKEVVSFLNELWKEGLINSEAFTQDYTKYQSTARGSGNEAKVGYTFGWELSDRFGTEVADQYVSIPPLKMTENSDIDVSWTYDYNQLNYGENMVQIASQSEHKEELMAFINELYDPVVSMQVLFGSIGPNIEENGDGTYSVLPPQDESMDPGTWKWTSTWADNGPLYIDDSLELELGEDMKSVGAQTEPLLPAFESVDPLRDVYPGLFIKYSQEDNNTLSLNNTDMMNLAMSNFSLWVTDGGIEQGWDSFVEQLKNMGLDENLEIMQRYYDDYITQLDE